MKDNLWLLVVALVVVVAMLGAMLAINIPSATCTCTECMYSIGSQFSITVPIGDKQVVVSGSIPMTFTCDEVLR